MIETPGMGDARQAAIDALIEEGFVDPDDGTVPRWRKGESVPVWTVPAQVVDHVLAAALPILHTEPTFTASEVKELTTKATEVALALGRKEAAEEIAVVLDACVDPDGFGTVVNRASFAAALAMIARNIASQPYGAAPERLTAPTGHSDLPPTPEAGRIRIPESCDCYKLPRCR